MTDGVHLVYRMEAPTWLGTWGAFWFVVLANAVVVYFFHGAVSERLEIEAQKKENGDGIKSCCHEEESAAYCAKEQRNGSGTVEEVGWKGDASGKAEVNASDKTNAFPATDINGVENRMVGASSIKHRVNNHNGCNPIGNS